MSRRPTEKRDDYDPAKDAHDSYFAAIEAKRQRGDTHDWESAPAKVTKQTARQMAKLKTALEEKLKERPRRRHKHG